MVALGEHDVMYARTDGKPGRSCGEAFEVFGARIFREVVDVEDEALLIACEAMDDGGHRRVATEGGIVDVPNVWGGKVFHGILKGVPERFRVARRFRGIVKFRKGEMRACCDRRRACADGGKRDAALGKAGGFLDQYAGDAAWSEMVMNEQMRHGDGGRKFIRFGIGGIRRTCYESCGMDAEQARRVLGLRSDEDWTQHESSFEVARQQMADLVRQSPTEAMAQRYQEGLMDFDRALAFFREQRVKVEEPVAIPYEVPLETVEPDISAARKSRGGVLVLVVIAVVAGSLYGLHEWQTRQEAKRQMQVASWEAEAADHLSKRRWQDALEIYQKIENAEGNDVIAKRGRRSIEAGMREEQEQYLGYWSGEAISAAEASRWADASAAIARVLERDPRHLEMIALSEKVRMMRSENQRKQWQEHAQQAMDQRQWETALTWIEKILVADPASETALAWKASTLENQRLDRENKEQAAALYQQALSKDQGVFDEELLQIVSRARQLAPQDEAIGALYQKIAGYGRTIRVPHDMSDLQKAFDSARDGDRVVIEAGMYVGSFTIKSALILEAAATGVVLSCPAEIGPALLLTREAQGAKISGVKFQHSNLLADAERFSAVLVSGASVSFDGCQFHRAAGHGLTVIGGGTATSTQCRFEENGWDGLAVQDAQSQVVVRESFFVGNIRHGIQLWSQSAGVLENNRFSQNCLNGIYLDTNAVVVVKNNQVLGNREYGMVLKAAGGGEITGNRFAENLLGGMVIGAEAKNAACRKNIFGKNGGHALSLEAGLNGGEYAENQFTDSAAKSILENVPMN